MKYRGSRPYIHRFEIIENAKLCCDILFGCTGVLLMLLRTTQMIQKALYDVELEKGTGTGLSLVCLFLLINNMIMKYRPVLRVVEKLYDKAWENRVNRLKYIYDLLNRETCLSDKKLLLMECMTRLSKPLFSKKRKGYIPTLEYTVCAEKMLNEEATEEMVEWFKKVTMYFCPA